MPSAPATYPLREPVVIIGPARDHFALPLKEKRRSKMRLLPLMEQESFAVRWLFLLVALTITAGYWYFLQSYWAPAPGRPGIDENAYLLGGRNIAEHGTVGFKPTDDFQFVDAMWVRTTDHTYTPPGLSGFLKDRLTVHTEAGWYYPKYPAGVSLLDAIAIRLGGAQHGIEWAFQVSPICMTLAVLGMFFLARSIAGSYCGILAMILIAMGNTSLELALAPDSHAPALCMVVWGMFMLVRWWQTGSILHGLAAGLLLGYAVTIRYTEALLLFPLYPLDQVLGDTSLAANHPHWWEAIKWARFLPIGPLGIATFLSIHWTRPLSWFRSVVPVIAWTIPVGLLVAFNWFSMGHVTGYDATNESTGFSTTEFFSKWDFTVHEVYLYGLFLFASLGIAGLFILFQRSLRWGLFLWMWFVPGALLYTSYYWGNRADGVVFLRFFLTLYPPLILAAMWLLRSAGLGAYAAAESKPRRGWAIGWALAAGVLTAASTATTFLPTLTDMEKQHRGNMNLQYSNDNIRRQITRKHANPARPMIFADTGAIPQLLQYTQFTIDADWYTIDAFEPRSGGGFGVIGLLQGNDQNSPVLIQRERISHMTDLLKGKSSADLVNLAHRTIDVALDAGRPVYAILTPLQKIDFQRTYISSDYQMKELDHWAEPCRVDPPFGNQPKAVIPRAPNPLAAPLLTGEPFILWRPEVLTMFEIHKKAAPATRVASK